MFTFSPLLGEMIQFHQYALQRGWFNHQLDKYTTPIDPMAMAVPGKLCHDSTAWGYVSS